MEKNKLRSAFERETRYHWENSSNEPTIEYVEWLESKLGVSSEDNKLLVENCEYFPNNCVCSGRYCEKGT